MASIYIHIPFCKQACNYCDFHFSTNLKNKQTFINALFKEIEIQKSYFSSNEKINTIYFGGGTPSLLDTSEIIKILKKVYSSFSIDNNAEITLEANPDDLHIEKLKELKATPINRLSIGVQSFYDEDLKWMNRAHNTNETLDCIKNAQKIGFNNITIDLIYGTPTLSNRKWLKNLQTAFDLNIQHISAYCLTVEPNTALDHLVKQKKMQAVDEKQSVKQFEIMLIEMHKNDFKQYEISNFCKDENYSKHNSNYWLKNNYLGLGPSAHSYNGNTRQWNVSNNNLYIKALETGTINFEKEELTIVQQYNEYMLTSLRTMWGADLNLINNKFGNTIYQSCLKGADKYIEIKHIEIQNDFLLLTDKGKLFADNIASDLFTE